jgi:uncharacterized protein YigE (DUF2233 family)
MKTSGKRPVVALAFLLTFSFLVIQDLTAADWEAAKELHPGIRLLQERRSEPRRIQLHCVRIDLATPGLKLCTTGRSDAWAADSTETLRQSTRDFMRSSARTKQPVMFATNADAFSPWPAPWNKSTPTNLSGLAVSDGVVVSPATGSPSLLVDKSGKATIRITTPEFPTDTIQLAVSGFALCLVDGKPQPSGDDLHPRTGLGISADGRFIFVMAIDGRKFSSRGATTHELGTWMQQHGADDAINMDGGGSTTLAWHNPKSESDDKCELINSPVGSGLKFESELAEKAYVPTERFNGNNLGVYYQTP